MSTYAYSNLNGHGHNHQHQYKKIDYPKTRDDEEKDHASYAAIIEYSQMQEKLLLNLRQQLEKIRGVDNHDTQMQQLITPSFVIANHTSQSISPSVAAFKNAAIAARKLPSQNSRNKQSKQITPTVLNPKRDYPRPWAVEKMQMMEQASDHNNFANFENAQFRPQAFKAQSPHNPQKQYYSSAMERHQPNPVNCAFHEQYNIQSLCRNCQIPMTTNEGHGHPEYFFPDQGNGNYDQYGQTQQIIPKIKGDILPSGQMSNSRPWNNYYVTEEHLNDNANSQFNSVVFPDPQAKKHPYLTKILEKTIPGTAIAFNSPKTPIVTSRTQKHFQAISQNQNTGTVGPVKIYNLMEMKQEDRQMFPAWGCSRIGNNRPCVSLNVKVNGNAHGGRKAQLVPKISSLASIGQGERQDEMTLLPPRCILSSLSPVWSQTSTQNKEQLKSGRRAKDPLATDSESDDGKTRKSFLTVKGKAEKDKSGSLASGRAVTYQVFTNNNKTLSEWGGTEQDTENKTNEPGKSIDESSKRKGKDVNRFRNAQSSGDESYGSMKVIRDSKEDFAQRIFEDFESYEDFDAAVAEKETEIVSVLKEKKTKSRREGEKPTVIKTEPQPIVVKAKDSRSLVRNQRLSFYKKRDGKAGSTETSRKGSALLKLPVVKKSLSWTSQTIQSNKSPHQTQWPTLIIDKMFPEVEKVLQEARGLSPFVDNMDKMLQSPPDLEKMIDDKLPWVSSKLTRFPTWFREVDPITKLGEHLTIDKVFQIDIKPGVRSSCLEEFITDSKGVFRGSKSTVCVNDDSKMSTAFSARKITSHLVTDVNNEEMRVNVESDMEPVRNIAIAQIRVAPKKHPRTFPVTSTTNFPVLHQQHTPSDIALMQKTNDFAGKAAVAAGTNRDINANFETSKMETLNKVIELGQAFAKSNFISTVQKKNTALRAKSIAKIVLPNPKLKMTPEETTFLEKLYPDTPKLDRRQLKRLMDNPGSYTHFDGTINTERLLKETNFDKEISKMASREKTSKKDKKRLPQTATGKAGTSSKPRKKVASKMQTLMQKNKTFT